MIGKLTGHSAIGHTRYSTTGENSLRNVQPLFADLHFGGFAIAHNGNLTNAQMLRQELVKRGSLFQSTTDTEVILHLMATHLRGNVIDRLIDALHQVEGAYSLVCIADDMVIGVRDPLGVRPLVLGKLGDGWILASETCALDIVGADFVRDVEPGELVVLDKRGVTSHEAVRRAAEALLHLRVHLLRAARQRGGGPQRLRCAQAHRRRARQGSAGRRPMSSSRCRIPACRPRSATPRPRASRSSSASSATTMSAAPSSSRPTRSAISA